VLDGDGVEVEILVGGGRENRRGKKPFT